jgi:hypothetical protein
MNAIFGAIIGLNLLNATFLVLFFILQKPFFRFFSHFAWIISVILIILFFLVGALFGLIGTLGMDLGDTLTYLFSASTISTLFQNDKSTSDMLNICINNDGDIATKYLGLGAGTQVGQISDLYTASATIKSLQTNITNNKNSITIPKVNDQYDAIIKDYQISSDDTSINGPKLTEESWWAFSDASQNRDGMSKCANPAKDMWVSDQSKCKSGYTYINAGSGTVGTASCLVITEWTASVIYF